jgi:putative Ca2+/H+ antiporter (TMEM165/GDT1 family)
MKLFLTVFISVFMAELGDKTQLATLLFSAQEGAARLLVFAAASAALLLATALAVLAGGLAERYLSVLPLKLLAGLGFLAIGAFLIAEHFGKA